MIPLDFGGFDRNWDFCAADVWRQLVLTGPKNCHPSSLPKSMFL